jgi:hypothetical protein
MRCQRGEFPRSRCTFPEVDAQRVRVLTNRTGSFGIGVKEIQMFDTAA